MSTTQPLVEELRENLKRTNHLSSDEQLRLLDDQLRMAEQKIADNEKEISTNLSKSAVMTMLAGGISHYGKTQAKQMFVTIIQKQIPNSKEWEGYWSLLQEKFPSSSRISSLAQRHAANLQHLMSLLKAIENY